MPDSSHWFHRAFIAPFLLKERAMNYIAIFIGAFGFAAMMTYFSYDFAQFGAFTVGLFFMARFAFANLAFIPSVFYGFYKLSPASIYSILIVLQLAVTGYVIAFPSFFGQGSVVAVLTAAIIFSLMSIPFWACFHVNMICYTSDENMGNEVSVSMLISFIGAMSGTLFTGFALAFFPGVYTLLGFFACLLLSTIIMAAIGWRRDLTFLKNRPFHLLKVASDKKMQLAATAQEGVFQFLIGFFAPVWMYVLGIKSVTMGMLLSLQGVIKLILSPIAGHLFHENKSRDIVLGACIKPLGWLPWILIQAPWVMVISSAIWTTGMHLYSVGMGSRWYQQRCLASQAVREMALGLGRIVCTALAVPVLYMMGAQAFFILAFIMTAMTSVLAIYFRRHENRKRDHTALFMGRDI